MTSRSSNQRNAHPRQSDSQDDARPGSRKFEGKRSANEAGDHVVNRAKPGRAQKKRSLKNADDEARHR